MPWSSMSCCFNKDMTFTCWTLSSKYLLASPQCGTLSQGVGEACSQPQHQQIALPQIANPLFLDADVTQLCQIQHNCEGERKAWDQNTNLQRQLHWAKPVCGVPDLFLALSSIRSGLKCTNWSSSAQSGFWFCQTQPPPIPPCSAWLWTDSRSRRTASIRCCLCEPHKEKGMSCSKRTQDVMSIESCKLINRSCKYSLCTWAVVCSCQTNRCYACN